MAPEDFIKNIADYALFVSCVLLLIGSILLTFKTRFVQVRLLPSIFRMFIDSVRQPRGAHEKHTIPPHRALLTAMSTTLGIGTIVAPVIAISLGGPGALLGFLLTSFFGSAATFIEVKLCIEHRKRSPLGSIMGGPMQYLSHIMSPKAAKWYAIFCFVLMAAWSGAQANQVAAIFDSPLLGDFRIPKMISGAVLAILMVLLLMGGIKRIGSFSAKLVPLMFVLYVGSSLWIVLSNIDKLGDIFSQMFLAALSPYEMSTGVLVGGIASALRWGIFKGIQVTEAGIGTQAIPHSMAETEDPTAQATIAMLSTYTAGFIAFLSGCVALITRTWEDPQLPIGINMVVASFDQYFSIVGVIIVCMAALLFGFGTILGNSFNGSQCFGYLTENRGTRYYFAATSIIVFIGTISEVKTFWAFSDLILACMALLHLSSLLVSMYRQPAEIQSAALVQITR
jgi:alanine or glycine:cation symporter, AGCS family